MNASILLHNNLAINSICNLADFFTNLLYSEELALKLESTKPPEWKVFSIKKHNKEDTETLKKLFTKFEQDKKNYFHTTATDYLNNVSKQTRAFIEDISDFLEEINRLINDLINDIPLDIERETSEYKEIYDDIIVLIKNKIEKLKEANDINNQFKNTLSIIIKELEEITELLNNDQQTKESNHLESNLKEETEFKLNLISLNNLKEEYKIFYTYISYIYANIKAINTHYTNLLNHFSSESITVSNNLNMDFFNNILNPDLATKQQKINSYLPELKKAIADLFVKNNTINI